MDVYEQLRRDEGVRRFPYTDTVGKLTIGVGRNLTDVGLSDAEISFLLHNDVEAVTTELQARIPWFNALDSVRQAVLVGMAFNLGFDGLEQFQKMLMACAAGNWNDAAQEMLNSKWAIEVGDRAVRLSRQLVTDQWV